MTCRRNPAKPTQDEQTRFYSRVLDDVQRLNNDEAWRIEGIDEEIALLRVRLWDLIEQSPERIDLQMKLASTIARLVKTRYQISSEQKKSLKAAITKVLEEVAVPLGVGIGVGVGGGLAD